MLKRPALAEEWMLWARYFGSAVGWLWQVKSVVPGGYSYSVLPWTCWRREILFLVFGGIPCMLKGR